MDISIKYDSQIEPEYDYDLEPILEKENIYWVNNIGHALIANMEYREIKIGNTNIDKQYGEWLNIWYELSNDNNKEIESLIPYSSKYKELCSAIENDNDIKINYVKK